MRTLKSAVMMGLGVALLASGCASWRGGTDDRSAGRVVDDNKITDEVEERLQREPVYKFTDVDVKTFSGIVQLSGFVSSNDQKQRAEQIAKNVPGVTQVINSLALKPESTPTPTGQATGNPNMNPNQTTPPATQDSPR